MAIRSERVRAQTVVGVLEKIAAQDALITYVGLSDRFSLKRLCRVNLATIKTDTGWTLEFVMEDDAVSYINKAIGPDGESYLSRMAVYDWLSQEDRQAVDAELLSAITSSLPS